MGSLPDFNTDLYFRNNQLFYELSTTTHPSMWGAYQVQRPAEMLPPGMLVPGFDTALSFEALAPNHLSYVGGYYDDVCDGIMKLEDFSNGGFQHNLKTTSTICPLDHPQLSNLSNDNWIYKVHDQAVPPVGEQSWKVGKYSSEERKDRILKYLMKRTQRNFNKTIKYACRKTLADKRVRVRGRFARNNEFLCEGGDKEVITMNNHIDNPHKEREFSDDDIVKIKHDEEEWLQEAMASLVYFPYVSG